MQTVSGKAFVLGDNIDTDQIIPAEFLSYNPSDQEERKFFGRYALSGVPADESGLPQGGIRFTPEDSFQSQYSVVVAGENFGCGSSREHAPLALAEAGCHMVIAQGWARIFYRNSINGGYLVPLECEEKINDKIKTDDEVEVQFDSDGGTIKNITTGDEFALKPLGDAAEIVFAGGIFGYAEKTGML